MQTETILRAYAAIGESTPLCSDCGALCAAACCLPDVTVARSMSGGNQQKAIIAREIDKGPELLVAVQPTRGLDVGAIEYIHKQIVAQRDQDKAVLLVSLELDEVMNLSDRILVMYEGEIVGEFDPKTVSVEELGLYMAGAKRQEKYSRRVEA